MIAKRFKVRKFVAKDRGIPRTFVAIVLRETAKALQLFGHGTTGDLIECCHCGRSLTHPVSRLVGIGPECGQHFWDESVLGPYGFTEAHAEKLRQMVHEIKVGPMWVPKSCIEIQEETTEVIEPPKQESNNGSQQQAGRTGVGTAEAARGTGGENPREDRRADAKAGSAGGNDGVGDRSPARSILDLLPGGVPRAANPPPANRTPPPGFTARFSKDGSKIEVRFPYDPDLVNKVKAMNLAHPKFERTSDDRWWNLAIDPTNVTKLIAAGCSLSAKVSEWYRSMTDPTPPRRELPEWAKRLYDFQRTGVEWLEAHRGRGIVGDEMGLGKTVQALAYLRLHPEALPAVVVCPASVKYNWKKEAGNWLNGTCETTVVGGRNRQGFHGNNQLIILNYDVLPFWIDSFQTPSFSVKTVILDESHYIKNPKAKRSQAVRKLCGKVPHIICLTGTPITNRPMEILEPVSLVAPSLFPNRFEFLKRYCDAKWNGYGWDFSGASNTEELHDKLVKTCMVRRLKKDVLTQLPPKVRTVVPLEIADRASYDALAGEVTDKISEALEALGMETVADSNTSTANALSQIERLKQAAVHGKLESAIEWIEDFIADDEKLVVFCHHRFVVEALMAKFGEKAVKIDGGTPPTERQAIVDRFQSNASVRLFVGTMAAKEGITLTAASNTAFVELWWTPGDHDQAEDRVHRIGQEADSVGAYYLVAKDTIEEDIAGLIDRKRKVCAGVLDGKKVTSESLLMELMKMMVQKSKAII